MEEEEEELFKKALIFGEDKVVAVGEDDEEGEERLGVEKSVVATGDDFDAEEGGGNEEPMENGLEISVTSLEVVSYLCNGNFRQKTMERLPALVIRVSISWPCMSHAKRKKLMSSGRFDMSVAASSLSRL